MVPKQPISQDSMRTAFWWQVTEAAWSYTQLFMPGYKIFKTQSGKM